MTKTLTIKTNKSHVGQAVAFLAAAAASMTAYADTSANGFDIGIYGVADLSITGTDSGYGSQTRIEGAGGWSASRIGIRASKDLGEGLKAIAVAEGGVQFSTGAIGAAAPANGINAGTASSGGLPGTGVQMFSRQMLAGLNTNVGQITIGRQYTMSYLGAGYQGAAKGDGLYGNGATLLPLIGAMPTRVNNSLQWKSPTVSGFYGMVTYFTGSENNVAGPAVSGTTTTTADAGKGWDLGGQYNNGPLTLAMTGWQYFATSWNTANEKGLATKSGYQLAANYDFGVAKVYADYVQGTIKGGNYENYTKTLSDANGYSVSALFPFGKHTIEASYASLTDNSVLAQSGQLYGVAYWYSIDKNTRFFAHYGKMNNSSTAAYALDDGGNLVGSVATAGFGPTGYGFGVNFSF